MLLVFTNLVDSIHFHVNFILHGYDGISLAAHHIIIHNEFASITLKIMFYHIKVYESLILIVLK